MQMAPLAGAGSGGPRSGRDGSRHPLARRAGVRTAGTREWQPCPVAGILLALRFVLELCLLGSAGVVGLAVTDSTAVGVLVAIGLVAAVATLWGALLAPRRRIDLPLAARVVLELALFLAVGLGLAWAGHRTAGLALVAAELVLLPLLAALGHPPGTRPEPGEIPVT